MENNHNKQTIICGGLQQIDHGCWNVEERSGTLHFPKGLPNVDGGD
jgi:hypothetical protein